MEAERVWAPSPTQGWVLGAVVLDSSLPADQVKVRDEQGETLIVKRNATLPYMGSQSAVEDLISLDDLNEAVILHNLRERYKEHAIYTYIGNIVVSVNPYTVLPEMGEQIIPQYRSAPRDALPPHLYALAHDAFDSMMNMAMSQSVVISGESGSGKTEATKIILKFLTVASASAGADEISAMILATNPVLEAFGNAKTLRNENSSRFGKLIQVLFGMDGSIKGAHIRNYLLENSRVVTQTAGERNYHVFYQFLAGATAQQLQRYGLVSDCTKYRYLASGKVNAEGKDDASDFLKMIECLKKLKFSSDELNGIMAILAGILHLGNVEFEGTEKSEIKDKAMLQKFCTCMQMPLNVVEKALTSRLFAGGNRASTYSVPLTRDQAVEGRDAFAKSIYSKLFDWLVGKMNECLTPAIPSHLFIAVLDIYGFEVFDKNSLEQFCINYANEKLHEQFNKLMFRTEQAEYKKEGVPWRDIKFNDNIGCIDLIERPFTGIIALMTEEAHMPKGSDRQLISKLAQMHSKDKYFGYLQRIPDTFEIEHYAGRVAYNIRGFLDKNKNTVTGDMLQCIATSNIPLLVKTFEEKGMGAGRGRSRLQRNETAVTQKIFRKDLQSLADLLEDSERHYVRCIKPNDSKSPLEFDPVKVLQQLKSNGITETVAIRKAGYSKKMPADAFYQRYGMLGIYGSDQGAVLSFLRAELEHDQFAVGKTKIFIRDAGVQKLEESRKAFVLSRVKLLQAYVRRRNGLIKAHLLREKERRRREEQERQRRQEEERRREAEETKRRQVEDEQRRREEDVLRRQNDEKARAEAEERHRQGQLDRMRAEQDAKYNAAMREREERERDTRQRAERAAQQGRGDLDEYMAEFNDDFGTPASTHDDTDFGDLGTKTVQSSAKDPYDDFGAKDPYDDFGANDFGSSDFGDFGGTTANYEDYTTPTETPLDDFGGGDFGGKDFNLDDFGLDDIGVNGATESAPMRNEFGSEEFGLITETPYGGEDFDDGFSATAPPPSANDGFSELEYGYDEGHDEPVEMPSISLGEFELETPVAGSGQDNDNGNFGGEYGQGANEWDTGFDDEFGGEGDENDGFADLNVDFGDLDDFGDLNEGGDEPYNDGGEQYNGDNGGEQYYAGDLNVGEEHYDGFDGKQPPLDDMDQERMLDQEDEEIEADPVAPLPQSNVHTAEANFAGDSYTTPMDERDFRTRNESVDDARSERSTSYSTSVQPAPSRPSMSQQTRPSVSQSPAQRNRNESTSKNRVKNAFESIKRKGGFGRKKSKKDDMGSSRSSLSVGGSRHIDRSEIDQIMQMNRSKDITKSLPFNFPPPPQHPGDFHGGSEAEYKEYMRKKAIAEEWENALVAYKLRHRQGDQAAMQSIVARLKEKLAGAGPVGKVGQETNPRASRGPSTRLSGIIEDIKALATGGAIAPVRSVAHRSVRMSRMSSQYGAINANDLKAQLEAEQAALEAESNADFSKPQHTRKPAGSTLPGRTAAELTDTYSSLDAWAGKSRATAIEEDEEPVDAYDDVIPEEDYGEYGDFDDIDDLLPKPSLLTDNNSRRPGAPPMSASPASRGGVLPPPAVSARPSDAVPMESKLQTDTMLEYGSVVSAYRSDSVSATFANDNEYFLGTYLPPERQQGRAEPALEEQTIDALLDEFGDEMAPVEENYGEYDGQWDAEAAAMETYGDDYNDADNPYLQLANEPDPPQRSTWDAWDDNVQAAGEWEDAEQAGEAEEDWSQVQDPWRLSMAFGQTGAATGAAKVAESTLDDFLDEFGEW